MTLSEIATRLYELPEARITDIFGKIFTKDELIKLWEMCKNDLDLCFDDEVYNALYSLGYFN